MSEPWAKFRNLCDYYYDCVKYSEKSQEYVFANQLNKTIMMPRLPHDWHRRDDEFIVQTSDEEKFVRSALLKASDEDELFVGYPLNSFVSPDGFECLCPIMLFPAEIAVRGTGYTTGMKMKIDRRGASLNQDWVDFHVPNPDQKAFRRACEQANDELGRLDAELVLNYIAVHFGETLLDPNVLDFTLRNKNARHGLLNTAVLFAGSKSKYTKNLLAELKQISLEADDVLDKTALAYVFRDPPFPVEPVVSNGDRRIPVSFS